MQENVVCVTERSRQKHDINVLEWSHVWGVGMDFQAKEWSLLFRNGLHHIKYVYAKNDSLSISQSINDYNMCTIAESSQPNLLT